MPAIDQTKLVDGERLLELLFDVNTRPCLRWLKAQRARRIVPYLKFGQLLFYDPMQVRAALSKVTVQGRSE